MIFTKIVTGVETKFDTSSIELGGQITKEFVGLRAKTCSYLKETMMKTKKQRHKKVWHKKKT